MQSFIFDLDNTLYPPNSSIWGQIDANISGFIMEYLGLERDEAFRVQKHYYEKYGTSLNGLIIEHGLDPNIYLPRVHNIDVSAIEYNAPLDEALTRITAPKYIFTSGTVAHAKNILGQLRLTHHFDGFFDIRASNFTPKPKQQAYDAFLAQCPLDPKKAIFFEDLARNLEVPKQMGMTTVLVQPKTSDTREAFEKAGGDAPYIDYRTSDLAQFLLDNYASKA